MRTGAMVGAGRGGARFQRRGPRPLRAKARRVVARRAAPPLESEKQQEAEERRMPRSIHDVDNGKILGFDADLSEDHPGFFDEEYKERRAWIASLARDFVPGETIPRLEYLPEEVETWAKALGELEQLFETHACKEFLEAVEALDFRPDVVPQLQDVHEVLQETSGFAIRPVAGLLHPRDFLNGLAFKTFHSTQYMRHHSQPMYTPEVSVPSHLFPLLEAAKALPLLTPAPLLFPFISLLSLSPT